MTRKLPRFLTGLISGDTGLGLLLAFAVFCVYFTTLGPSIGFIDAGELAAVAHTFGVAHPTGYPLFTLLAGAFSHLPLGGTVIWKLNLFAALCCAASVFFFFRVFLSLATPLSRSPQARAIAATAALALAFSRTFWSQSTGIEVYSLHLLLASLILFLFLRALPENGLAAAGKADPSPRRRRWFLFAFVLGLGFTNHLTTLLLLPALCVAYFTAHGWKRGASWRVAGLSLPFFFAGLLPYLYLPLRAATWPAMNWGAIVDGESFVWHVTGKQYSGWMFSSLEPAGRNLARFFGAWPSEFGYVVLALAAVGAIGLALRAPRILVFALLLFVGCLGYAVNYDISDVVNYFLLAQVATALAAAFGALFLLERARSSGARAAVLAACAAAVAIPAVSNYREVDESGNYGVEDYAREVLGAVEPNAVILTYDWDLLVAGAWYLQTVEGYRTDVLVLDRELFRRAWYLRQLSHQHPELTGPQSENIEAFLAVLRKFDLGEPYHPRQIQFLFEDMIRGLINEAMLTRPVYASPEVERTFTRHYQIVPEGALFRLHPFGETPPVLTREFSFRPFPKDNVYFRLLRERYASAYVNQAVLLAQAGDFARCERFLRKALEVDPAHARARSYLDQLEHAERQ